MIRLLGVELTRLRKRRAVFVLVIACLVLPLLFLGAAVWNTRPVSDAELSNAKAQLAQDRKSLQGEIRECVQNPGDWGATGTDKQVRRQCRQMMGEPQLRWYVDRTNLGLKPQLHGDGGALIAIVTVLLMLGAATFIGHDWNSGSMSNQLLFEPRRPRVFWAKALAVLLGAFGVAALAYGIYFGGIAITMQLRDLRIHDGVPGEITLDLTRAALFAAAGSLGAYAVTNLFRSTVVTLGILFAVMVAGSIVVEMIPLVDRGRWQMVTNVAAWIFGEGGYYRHVPESCYAMDDGRKLSGDCREYGTVDLWGAVRYFGALLALSVGLSAWSFQRRDVG